MQAINEMKFKKKMPSVGNCCTLTGLQFVFITLHNDFFNNTPLKNSVYYIFVFYT